MIDIRDQTQRILAENSASWLAVVARRHSRRSYSGREVAAPLLDGLEAVLRDFRPYPDARVALVRSPGVDVFKGIVGSYGKVSDAPHLLVFAGDAEGDFANQHVGYTGEGAVLEATRLGLDTCWVGGFFDPHRAARLVNLAPHERVYAVSPLGYATAERTRSELTLGLVSHRRRTVEQLAWAERGEQWPQWAIAAVETARLAPSANNRQPWRFRFEQGCLVIAKDSPVDPARLLKVAKRLDIGIAMLHAELAARAHGVLGRWEDLPGQDVARFVPTR